MSKRIQITDEEFVGAWLKATSYADLTTMIGLAKGSIQSVRSRAKRLREVGVNLPKYERAKQQIDIDNLNKMIATAQQKPQ